MLTRVEREEFMDVASGESSRASERSDVMTGPAAVAWMSAQG